MKAASKDINGRDGSQREEVSDFALDLNNVDPATSSESPSDNVGRGGRIGRPKSRSL